MPLKSLVSLVLCMIIVGPAIGHDGLHERIRRATVDIGAAPTNSSLYLTRAELHRQHADWTAAFADVERASAADADSMAIGMMRARLFLDAGCPQASLVILNDLVVRDNVGTAVHWHRGIAFERLARPADAAVAYGDILHGAATRLPSHYLACARSLVDAGRPGRAIAVLDEGMADLGNLTVLQERAIDIARADNQFETAIERVDAIIAQARRSEKWLALRADLYDSAGCHDAALDDRLAAIRAIESLPHARRKTGFILELEAALRAQVRVTTDAPRIRLEKPMRTGSDRVNRPHGIVAGVLAAAFSLGTQVHAETIVFEAGTINGLTSDTWLSEVLPNVTNGQSLVVEWDGSDGGGQNHALIRFDQVYGLQPGQITPTDQVTSATLEYNVINEGNVGDVHEVLVDWTESTTWNTFGDDAGVQPDEYGPKLVAASGTLGWHAVNITKSVVAWASDPTSNRGWIVRPGGSNGVQFTSSEGAPSTRPRLVVVINEGPPPAATILRGPYLQMGTSESAIVRWRTNDETNSRVSYGLSPRDLTSVVDAAGARTDHELLLAGLQPDTTYYYSIGTIDQTLAGGDTEHFFRTPPIVGTSQPTRIWVVGDSGTGDENAAAVYDAYRTLTGESYTDLWLMLGDNAYTDGTDSEYQVAVFEMYPELLRQTFVWPTIGNHDGHSADSATESGPYYDIFSLPRQGEAGGLASGTEAYYSFDYANIHFVCLDSYDTDTWPDGDMMMWLENDLADTLADWVIAYWHHPPYTKGSHDSDKEGQLIDMRQRALPILEAAGVDLVLCGHSHSYERSFLLDGHHGTSDTLLPEMIIDGGDGREDGDGAYDKLDGGPNTGAVYIVAGSSGKTSDGPLDHPAMFISLQLLGSVVLEVEGDRLDASFLLPSGLVGDSLTMLKNVEALPCFDMTGDGLVDVQDMLVLLAQWGPCEGCDADLDDDGDVGTVDLLAILSGWGPCVP